MNFLDSQVGWAHWLLRLALGSVFLFHGIGKVATSGAYNMMVVKQGMPEPVFWLVTFAEIAGGAGIIIGGISTDLITRLSGLAIAPVMIGAIFLVHLENGWSFMNNGVEFQVVLLLIALYFLIVGNNTPEPDVLGV